MPDINKAKFGFEPDIKNNVIIYGLKGMAYVGDDVIQEIITNRPYNSFADFVNKNPNINKRAMVSLIKGGCFDNFDNRFKILITYIYKTAETKKKLNLQNFAGLVKYDLLPATFERHKKIYMLNKYLKAHCAKGNEYVFDATALAVYNTYFTLSYKNAEDHQYIPIKIWDTLYQGTMDDIRAWISSNHDELLKEMNSKIFMEEWEKYCGKSNLSAWEMESLCYYYHEHELINLNYNLYGLTNFFDLPEEPIVDRIFYKKQAAIPLYKIFKIIGTCVAKDKTKSSITLLTRDGVVNVKFRKEYFALFDKQISEVQEDNSKKVKEKSWFKRGNILMIQGIRRGDDFIPKKYSNTAGHQLYKILDVTEAGEMIVQSERYNGDE